MRFLLTCAVLCILIVLAVRSCSMVLQCSSDFDRSIESHMASLLHVFSAFAAAGATNRAASSREEEHSEEGSETFPLTNVSEHTPIPPQHHSADGERGEMHVFAGDDQGFVTAWRVQRQIHHAASTVSAHSIVSNGATLETATTTNSHSTAVLQHEEMVLGYDAIAGLYRRALEKDRPEAVPPGNGSRPSTRYERSSDQRMLAPTTRWKAHSGPILCLNFAADPQVLLTSSTRGRIKVWSFQGELLGILDDFASRRMPVTQPWRFPVDMVQRQRRKEIDAQQFLEKSKGLFRRSKQTRTSVMQERLSLSHEELTFDYSAEKKTRAKRHSRSSAFHVRGSDVGRAIRKFILAQAAPEQAAASASPSALRRKDASQEPSLRTFALSLCVYDRTFALTHDCLLIELVLKEIDQLHLQTTARDPTSTRKKYPRVTLADVKSLRPRSSNAVHCDINAPSGEDPVASAVSSASQQIRRHVPALEDASKARNSLLFKPKRKEMHITSANEGKGSYALRVSKSEVHLTLRDLRDEPPAAAAATRSNQELANGDTKAKSKRPGPSSSSASKDPVLKYHVKLAHSWQQYQVR